jgi:hypothetical protein
MAPAPVQIRQLGGFSPYHHITAVSGAGFTIGTAQSFFDFVN